LLYLGAISYALYLIQCASFGSVNVLSEASARYFLGLGLNPWASAGLTMLICIGAAMVVHHGFESPVQQWLRRKLLRRPTS
jgi:peptidoglycan/LPS O-acetylase OafA/YrhL